MTRRGLSAEGRTKPLLDEANATVRMLGKGVSTTRRRMAEKSGAPDPMDKDGQ